MKRKNILLVSFDDAVAPWPYKTAFNEPLQTPNLDRLCAVSTAFHAAYAQAPICGPSRASMMTTMMPHELGIVDNSIFVFDKVAPETVWSHCLKENGYFCSSGGKVHHRYKPLPRVQHRVLYSDDRKHFSNDMGLPGELRRRATAYGGHRNGRGTQDGTDDDFFYDAQSANSAIKFLMDHDGSQPFYREVGLYSPHTPHITPARFKEMYDSRNLRRPAGWDSYSPDNAFASATLPDNDELQSEDWWRKSVRNYFSAYSHGDYQLGRVLDALNASGHAAETIVIVVSDHGFHLGSRNLFRKSTMWEQSLRVPFVIHDPDNPVGQVVDDPVALIDLGPTVLDFAQVAAPQRRHGRSLRPYMQGARGADRVIPSFFRQNVAVRKGPYRIIRYGDGSFQLFDIEADVWQLHDLGTDHPMFAEMHRVLADCAADCGFDFVKIEPQATPTMPEPEDADTDETGEDA
jgi:choline-sulfatase